MGAQAGQDVMAVLPDGFGYHQGGIRWYLGENSHPHLLAVNEPVPLDRVVTVGPAGGPPEIGQSRHEGLLELLLHRPAGCVRRQAQVATGNQPNGLGLETGPLGDCRQLVVWHGGPLVVLVVRLMATGKLSLQCYSLAVPSSQGHTSIEGSGDGRSSDGDRTSRSQVGSRTGSLHRRPNRRKSAGHIVGTPTVADPSPAALFGHVASRAGPTRAHARSDQRALSNNGVVLLAGPTLRRRGCSEPAIEGVFVKSVRPSPPSGRGRPRPSGAPPLGHRHVAPS